MGIVNYVEFLLFICLKYKAKKSKTYRKLTMPEILCKSWNTDQIPKSVANTFLKIKFLNYKTAYRLRWGEP